ncbi:MAG: hypothetical protein KC468_10905, partial [Myxococcales bacterium]|nr:hypothetical protein [Myxococcales bacterium]
MITLVLVASRGLDPAPGTMAGQTVPTVLTVPNPGMIVLTVLIVLSPVTIDPIVPTVPTPGVLDPIVPLALTPGPTVRVQRVRDRAWTDRTDRSGRRQRSTVRGRCLVHVLSLSLAHSHSPAHSLLVLSRSPVRVLSLSPTRVPPPRHDRVRKHDRSR